VYVEQISIRRFMPENWDSSALTTCTDALESAGGMLVETARKSTAQAFPRGRTVIRADRDQFVCLDGESPGRDRRRWRDDSRSKAAFKNTFSAIYDTLNTHSNYALTLITN
jgi:hypothetical protein